MREVCSVLGALFAGCKDLEKADRPNVTVPPVSGRDESHDVGAGLPPGVKIIYTHGELV